MRALLDHVISIEDLILIVSLFFNVIGFFAVLVVVDVRYANWRRRRDWIKSQLHVHENVRNPAYGVKRKDDPQ